MKIGFSTDVGLKREINQDSLYVSEQQLYPIVAVADGMGGHKAGEVASQMFVETIKKYEQILLENPEENIPKILRDLFEEANREIYAKSQDEEECRGMGTTATVAIIDEPTMYIAHVGDSRLYIYECGQLKQLTKDHSVVGEMLRSGEISAKEAINHPQKNIITKAVGTSETLLAEFSEIEIDTIIVGFLCSDGLTNMLTNDEIEEVILDKIDNLNEASRELVKRANENGGTDNITVILIKFD